MLSAESATKAWLLRDRVSDRERFFIDFIYDRQVTGNLEKAYQTLELWSTDLSSASGDGRKSQDLLGGISTQGTGRFERAIEAAQEGIAADPDLAIPYGNLALAYFFTDRFAEAESTLQRASARKLEMPTLSRSAIQHRGAKGRPGADGPGRQVRPGESARRNTGWPTQEALALARSGRLQAARRSSEPRRGTGPAREGNAKWPRRYPAARAVWEAICGNAAEGRKAAMAALELSKGRDVEYAAGLALALSGEFFPIRGARRRFGKALPGRYFCEIYLRAGPARVSRTGAGQARRQRGAAGNRSSV